MKRIARTLALLAAFAGGIVPISAAEASTEPAPATTLSPGHVVFGPTPDPSGSPAELAPDCPSQTLCGWVDNGHSCAHGCEYIPVEPANSTEQVALPNQWSSVFNNSGRSVRLHSRADCTGTGYVTIANGSHWSSILLVWPSYNDNIECVRFM
jgi:hypothetical protein